MTYKIGNLELIISEISCITTIGWYETPNKYSFKISFKGGGKHTCIIRAEGDEINEDLTGGVKDNFMQRIKSDVDQLIIKWRNSQQ